MILPPFHPALFGPAFLYHLKRGKAITRLTVYFTHGQLHRIFSPHIADKYPLEMVLGEGLDMEKRIDCRLFEVPWIIDLRTAKEKKAARVPFAVRVATPPKEQKTTQMELEANKAAQELLEPFSVRAEWEYRLSVVALQKNAQKASPGRPHPAPVEDRAHG